MENGLWSSQEEKGQCHVENLIGGSVTSKTRTCVPVSSQFYVAVHMTCQMVKLLLCGKARVGPVT